MSAFNNRERGFTLVELMIALTLGLVISLTAMQLFITGVSSYNFQRGVGDVNDNGRFALDFIARNIRMYQPRDNRSPEPGVILSGDIPSLLVTSDDRIVLKDSYVNGVALRGTLGSTDQLVTRTWVGKNVVDFRDCEGNLVPSESFSVSRYFLRADLTANSGSSLACDAGFYSPSDAGLTNYGDNGVVLLTSVDSFQVLYGVAPTPLVVNPVPVRYVGADRVGTDAIMSVRLGIMLRSSDSVGGLGAATGSVNVLDRVITNAELIKSDKTRVRRVFTSTVALRNTM